MGKIEKLYEHILMRRSDANVPFETLCALLKRLGFRERAKVIITFLQKMALRKYSTYSQRAIKGNRTKLSRSGI